MVDTTDNIKNLIPILTDLEQIDNPISKVAYLDEKFKAYPSVDFGRMYYELPGDFICKLVIQSPVGDMKNSIEYDMSINSGIDLLASVYYKTNSLAVAKKVTQFTSHEELETFLKDNYKCDSIYEFFTKNKQALQLFTKYKLDIVDLTSFDNLGYLGSELKLISYATTPEVAELIADLSLGSVEYITK